MPEKNAKIKMAFLFSGWVAFIKSQSDSNCFLRKSRIISQVNNKEIRIRKCKICSDGYALSARSGIEKNPQMVAADKAAEKYFDLLESRLGFVRNY
jgi:hypothetical protein